MSERFRFIARLEEGESMSALCREFGISRKTGYKILARYEAEGADAVLDRSRRPLHSPWKTPQAIVEQVVKERRAHPTWGPKKLKAVLQRKHPGVAWPAYSTMWSLLKREGLVAGRKRRRAVTPHTEPLRHATGPNTVWCADFKGQFKLGNGSYCYPLTVTDAYSRSLLGVVAQDSTREADTMASFADVFRTWGLPAAIRTDNGVPFASCGLLGLSRLSIWWRRLGVDHERIEAGHPEQNGRHERMHRTLKAETTRPAADTLLQQQDRFDRFQDEFNQERPHEALEGATPSTVYAPCERRYPASLSEPVYPLHDRICRVTSAGNIDVPTARRTRVQIYISTLLRGELEGVRETADDRWQVSFLDLELGIANTRTRRLEAP